MITTAVLAWEIVTISTTQPTFIKKNLLKVILSKIIVTSILIYMQCFAIKRVTSLFAPNYQPKGCDEPP